MEVLPRLKKVIWVTFFVMLFSSSSVFSDNLLITRSFSGIWEMPDHESQGIILQIGEQEDENGDPKKVGVAYWFTYGEDLQTTWFLGVGPVEGNEIPMTLYTASDIGFMAENLEGDANVKDVGKLKLVFHNCNQGDAFFETDEEVIGSGEFRIKRINSIYHDRCSGGIADDTPAGGKPTKLEVWLLSARDGYKGKGKAKFWKRTDRYDFQVEAEEVPNGSYTLKVCEDDQGQMIDRGEVLVEDGAGLVEFEFRSPESDGKANLTFEPHDCRIELWDAEGVFLTSGDEVLSE